MYITPRAHTYETWLHMHLVTRNAVSLDPVAQKGKPMCKAPNTLSDGTVVACRKCSLCRDRKINDWVGRNIAESKTARGCHAVTLTYGRNKANDVDHERASLLTYSDVQKYLKLLRRHGYPVRYHVTGEYGSTKGRAHWHIMLYWQDEVPPHVLDKNFMQEHWPHGWSYWTEPSFHAVRYNCKYIMKDMGDDERQGHLAMSKKPPLGTKYFEELAEQYVREGLAPQTPEYRFPGVRRRKKDGSEEVIPFWLKGRPLELFLDHYMATWRKTYTGIHWPNSELVDLYQEFGRVVWDEDRATERMVAERAADRKFERFEKESAKAARSLVKPRAMPRDADDWWAMYVREANGEEKQKRQQEYDRYQRNSGEYWIANEVDWYDEPQNDAFPIRSGAGCSVSGDRGDESVDERFSERQGERVDTSVPVKLDYGPSKLDRLATRYAAFKSSPKPGNAE